MLQIICCRIFLGLRFHGKLLHGTCQICFHMIAPEKIGKHHESQDQNKPSQFLPGNLVFYQHIDKIDQRKGGKNHSGIFYNCQKSKDRYEKPCRFFYFILIIVNDRYRRQGKNRQMKVHKKIVDSNRQIQKRRHRKSHGDKRIHQKSSFFSYDAKNRQKACKQQHILGCQHNSLVIAPKTTDVINKNTDSQGVILKSNEIILHRREMIGCQHIFYNDRPVGKVVIMLHLQEK